MFKYTIDSKQTYTNKDGIELVDLSDTAFSTRVFPTGKERYRVIKEYEMRPDLISKAIYGTEEYAEFVMKYSNIDNPFAIEKNDVVLAMSINEVDNFAKSPTNLQAETVNLLKNYHKYIDKSKVPATAGSEKNDIETTSYTEPNFQKSGDSGIHVVDGKIFFGDVPSKDDSPSDPVSAKVECAKNGVTIGEFLTASLKNSNR